MRGDELLDVLEYIKPTLIEQASYKPRTNWLRWTALTASLSLVILFLIIFASRPDVSTTPNLPYEIVVENSVLYLVMDEIENKPDNFNVQVDYSIYFGSVDEMMTDIKTGNFTEEELYFISHYPKDDLGRIQVCNFDSFLVPAVPTPLKLTGICWNGLWFTYLLGCEGNDTVYAMLLDTKEQYEETIDFNANFATKTTCKVHSQTTEEDRNATATYYTNLLGEDSKVVYYTIGEGDSAIHVMEDYVLKNEIYELTYISITCSDNGTYFHYYSTTETERPSVVWLSLFGIREYKETATA